MTKISDINIDSLVKVGGPNLPGLDELTEYEILEGNAILGEREEWKERFALENEIASAVNDVILSIY